jgi:hypothetical protein
MSVDVYISTGLNIQVTPQVSPAYVVGNLPVLVSTGMQGATQAWVDSGYYPRSNPSGYATGVDGSLYVRRTESGQFVTTGQTGAFATTGWVASTFMTTGQIIKFSTPLNSGVESQTISYPLVVTNKPTALSCEMENNVDNLIYSHVLLSVTTSGFVVGFSDYLSSSGYTLYTTLIL